MFKIFHLRKDNRNNRDLIIVDYNKSKKSFLQNQKICFGKLKKGKRIYLKNNRLYQDGYLITFTNNLAFLILTTYNISKEKNIKIDEMW